EVPLKASKNHPLTKEQKTYNTWHAKLRIGVEHGICRMKKFRIFAVIHRYNGQADMIAKNVGALANLNLKTA
ncbi:MAG: transposase family protein, partial [Rhodobacteraceae bacterium]|nr:transposase family protein [Paracoccaceae bacterium]